MGQTQTVVITGAGGRLGRVMSDRFAARGDHVIRIDRSGEHGFGSDMTDEAAVSDVFSAVARAVDSIDVVIHTVGMWAQWPILDTPLQDFERMMRINLTSAFLCFREAVRHMERPGGTIIGIGAKSGIGQAGPMGAAYAASKAGLMRLVESVAAEHPIINCFAIAASYILYGDDPTGTRGVAAADLVDLAIELTCNPAAPSGTTFRAFGSLA